MKLGLGTAQFGLDYGISNARGKVPLAEARRILEVVRASDMTLIDTAPSYGDSEAALGELLQGDVHFRLVTKTKPMNGEAISKAGVDRVEKTYRESLSRLRVKSAYGLLVHHADDLLGPGGLLLVNRLQLLVRAGLVHKIGVSVYSGAQIDRLLDLFRPDIIQLPLNVFDQRLVESGHLARLHERGIEIHARSVFLQGLLLMEPKVLHPFFAGVQNHFDRYRQFIVQEGSSPLEMAVQFVIEHAEINTALVGVAAASELEEIINVCRSHGQPRRDWHSFAIHDENVLNPSLWRLTR